MNSFLERNCNNSISSLLLPSPLTKCFKSTQFLTQAIDLGFTQKRLFGILAAIWPSPEPETACYTQIKKIDWRKQKLAYYHFHKIINEIKKHIFSQSQAVTAGKRKRIWNACRYTSSLRGLPKAAAHIRTYKPKFITNIPVVTLRNLDQSYWVVYLVTLVQCHQFCLSSRFWGSSPPPPSLAYVLHY